MNNEAEKIALDLEGKWTVRDHDERGYQNGCSTRTWWSELERDGKHIAHFPDGDMARLVLDAIRILQEQSNGR